MKTATLKAWLSVLALFGFLGCLFILFFVEIPTASRDVLLVMIGALVTTVKDIYGYFFGSSSGSERKTELLANSPTVPAAPAVPLGVEDGFALVRFLPILAALGLLFMILVGCAGKSPQQTAALTLLTTQKTVVSAAEIVDSLCRAGKIAPDKCDRARDAYGKAGKSYDLAADALIAATRLDNAEAWDRYAVAEKMFTPLAGDFLKLAVEFNAIPGGGK